VVYLPAEGQTLVEEDEEGQATQSSMIVGDSVRPLRVFTKPLSLPFTLQRFDTVRQHPSANGETAPNPIPSALRPSTPPADFSNAQEEPHEEIQPSFDAPGVIVTPPQVSVSEREAKPAPEEPAPAPVPVVVYTPAPAPAPPVARTPSIPTPASLPAALPPTDDYAAKYADAHAEIERLRKLLAESQPPAELRRRTRKLSDATAVDVAVLEEAAIQEGVPLQVVVIIALGVFITTYLFF
jgi:hypothetical protein